MTFPAISAVGIDYHVKSRAILSKATLEANHGELVGLVGPNGAGKSTLLSALAGDLTTSGGVIQLDGTDISQLSKAELARRRAVVTQSFGVSFPFTVREVVRMGRSPWTTTRETDEQMIDAALDECSITHLQHQPLPTLSGGERARVAFARALAQSTQVLLLDEPTAALDIAHQEALLSSARRRSDDGAAIVCVLHDLNLAAAYCDRLALMQSGTISHVGTPSDVCDEAILTEAYRHPIATDRDADGVLTIRPRRSIKQSQV